MQKLYFSLLAFLVMSSLQPVAAQNADQAKGILDKVSVKLKSINALSANFTRTTTDRNKTKKATASGIMYIKGNKFYIKEDQVEIFSNGAKTWNYNGEDEVTIQDVDPSDANALTPRNLMGDFYKTGFTYNLVSSSGDTYQVQLVPTDKRRNFSQVTVYVSKSKTLVTKVRVLDKSGNTIEIAFSNFNTNASIADSKFVFDPAKHPGVEVISE